MFFLSVTIIVLAMTYTLYMQMVELEEVVVRDHDDDIEDDYDDIEDDDDDYDNYNANFVVDDDSRKWLK